MRNLVKQLHIWFSIPLGITISIICFTGAILVFEKEITRHVQHEYHYVEPLGEPIPTAVLQASVEASLPEGKSIERIEEDADPRRSIGFRLGKRETIYVNQYTGEILGTPERLKFFTVAFRMHRWLMDSPEAKGEMSVGKMVVGISTLAMVIILITGCFLWWPKTLKMWLNRSVVSVRKGWHRFWYDLHAVGGIYATLLLLIMALTGLVWSFEWYRDGFYALFGEDARTWLRALHTGTIGGIATKIMWAAAAFIGGTLPLTGYYLWIKRLLRRKR